MSGAAGGLAGGLWAHFGAKLVPGAPYVLDALGFEDGDARAPSSSSPARAAWTASRSPGKAAGEVATRCRQSGVACRAVVGSVELDAFEERILDLERVEVATTLAGAGGRRGAALAHQET